MKRLIAICKKRGKTNGRKPLKTIVLLIFMIPVFCSFTWAQQTVVNAGGLKPDLTEQNDYKVSMDRDSMEGSSRKRTEPAPSNDDNKFASGLNFRVSSRTDTDSEVYDGRFLKLEDRSQTEEFEIESVPPVKRTIAWNSDEFEAEGHDEKFHWKPALKQSLYFLGIQHSLRLFQRKTVRELDGPFFRDWGQSVRNLSNWRDGDGFVTNYIAHPMQGAVTGWIFINNSDRSIRQEFGSSKAYWESRFKAMAWSAVWSAQFELGPISEASIGNVGQYDGNGQNYMGWVDLVVTPTAGTGVIILEDIIDKYILKNWLEKKLTSRTRIKIYRTFFNPFQSFTNVLRWKKPWRRRNR